MPAAYDTYDYPSYWDSREYEHKSEIFALKTLLDRVSKIKSIIDIGAGYGRLTPAYSYRAKKITLADPSSKLLKIARKNNSKSKKITYIHSTLENLQKKVKPGTYDLVMLVRVMHHIKDLDKALNIISRISSKKSYLIMEFPNKRHVKEIFLQFLKGNFTFPLDIFPKDLRSKKSIRKNDLPFVNYHPAFIKEQLSLHNYRIVKTLSVSNLRYTWFKTNLPLDFVLKIEKFFQQVFSSFMTGPSVFLLAKKIKKRK